jgi:hypothetical protein
MNYMLSPEDELRMEARFVTRDREPVFEEIRLSDSSNVFVVHPKDTRRMSFLFSGNFLLFTRDVLTGSVQFTSATISGEDRAIPFEPTFRLLAAYHFNSISTAIEPSLEFQSISRSSRTINLVNVEARIPLMTNLSLQLRGENLLGSSSDFWTGYEETPRSFWASARYAF